VAVAVSATIGTVGNIFLHMQSLPGATGAANRPFAPNCAHPRLQRHSAIPFEQSSAACKAHAHDTRAGSRGPTKRCSAPRRSRPARAVACDRAAQQWPPHATQIHCDVAHSHRRTCSSHELMRSVATISGVRNKILSSPISACQRASSDCVALNAVSKVRHACAQRTQCSATSRRTFAAAVSESCEWIVPTAKPNRLHEMI
jgi:hypothetical protein